MADHHDIPPEFQRLSMEMSMLREELDARRQAAERHQQEFKRMRGRLRVAGFALLLALGGLLLTTIFLIEAHEELNHYHNVAAQVYTAADVTAPGDSLLLAAEAGLALPLQVTLIVSRLAEQSPQDVSLNSELRSDLKLSLDDFTRLARTLKEHHELVITYSEVEEVHTVGDLLYLLERKLLNKPAPDVPIVGP